MCSIIERTSSELDTAGISWKSASIRLSYFFVFVVALSRLGAVRTVRWIFITDHLIWLYLQISTWYSGDSVSYPSPTETWHTADSLRSLTKMTFCFYCDRSIFVLLLCIVYCGLWQMYGHILYTLHGAHFREEDFLMSKKMGCWQSIRFWRTCISFSFHVFRREREREMNQHYRTMNHSLIIAMRTDYFTGNHASVMGDGVGRANSSH